VCVLDDAGTKLAHFQIGHTVVGFQHLVRRLAQLGDPVGLPVASSGPRDGWSIGRW
jgi:hypothetical protein